MWDWRRCRPLVRCACSRAVDVDECVLRLLVIAHTDVLMCDLVDRFILLKWFDLTWPQLCRHAPPALLHRTLHGIASGCWQVSVFALQSTQHSDAAPPPHPHHFVKMICCCAHSLQTGQGHAGVVCDARCIWRPAIAGQVGAALQWSHVTISSLDGWS